MAKKPNFGARLLRFKFWLCCLLAVSLDVFICKMGLVMTHLSEVLVSTEWVAPVKAPRQCLMQGKAYLNASNCGLGW